MERITNLVDCSDSETIFFTVLKRDKISKFTTVVLDTMIEKQEIADAIKKAVQEVEPQAETILFGSRARGEEKRDSDWDILILVPYAVDLKEEQRFRHRLFEVELNYGQAISTFVYSRSTWEGRLSVTPLFQNIQQEGVTL